MGSHATYSVFRDDLYVSFGVDNLIHHVQRNTLTPAFKINITPKSSEFYDRFVAGFQGYVGSYLFINYSYNMKRKLFIYNTKTKRGYHISDDAGLKNQGIRDNMYGTGHITKLTNLNRPGYFYYIKEAGTMKEMPKGVTGASHPVVFIAKIKD